MRERQPTKFKKAVLKITPKPKPRKASPFKPMKPWTIRDPSMGVKYPKYCTPKVDGIRCVTFAGGDPRCYSLKSVPNLHIQKVLKEYGVEGLDGELVMKDAKTFGEGTGPIMKADGEPDFIFYIFDKYNEPGTYLDRVAALDKLPKPMPPCIKLLKPVTVTDAEGFMKYWSKCADEGFEGVIARGNLYYKHGRSGTTEQEMGKYKNFEDAEAEIIGYEEMNTNNNPKTTNLHGRSERGSSKAGKVPNGYLGKWLCRDLKTGIEFGCGTFEGVKMAKRKEFWDNRQIYLGYVIKYKYQPSGKKEKPRFPVMLGFRHKDDM